MGQRGRKSGDSQAVAPVASIGGHRPEPDESLTEDQQKVWREVADAMPPNWFGPEHNGMLRDYCRHQARADAIAAKIDDCFRVGLNCEDQIKKVDTLTRMADRESKMALALARAMRITQQAQVDPKTAGRARRNNPSGKKPWER